MSKAVSLFAIYLSLCLCTATSRELQVSKSYTFDLVNTFSKGRGNDVKQDVKVNLEGPEKMPEVQDPDNPQPVVIDPDNPKCDLDHPYAYPTFDITAKPIGRTDWNWRRLLLSSDSDEKSSDKKDSSDELKLEDFPTKTFQVFVGVDYQVKPVLVGRLQGRRDSRIRVDGSGLETAMDLDRDTPKKTVCGDWFYSTNGRYEWTFTVTEDAEAELYYYVKLAPHSTMQTFERMPVNVNYRHEFTIAGSRNELTSRSNLDTAGRAGKVNVALDNVVAGGDNNFDQSATMGSP